LYRYLQNFKNSLKSTYERKKQILASQNLMIIFGEHANKMAKATKVDSFLIQDIRASVDFFLSIQTQEVGPYNHDTCLLYLLFQYLK
jgi:hypothetical protein